MPDPPGGTQLAYDMVRSADRSENTEARKKLRTLPRPWVPARCEHELREEIWGWCNSIVSWLNEQYAWRPDQLIPPCWPRHPHLAQELPVVCFLRWVAEIDPDMAPLETWHRETFPGFCNRMAVRLGPGGCRDGKHADCPAQPRRGAYASPANVTDIRNAVSTDARDHGCRTPGGGTLDLTATARRADTTT